MRRYQRQEFSGASKPTQLLHQRPLKSIESARIESLVRRRIIEWSVRKEKGEKGNPRVWSEQRCAASSLPRICCRRHPQPSHPTRSPTSPTKREIEKAGVASNPSTFDEAPRPGAGQHPLWRTACRLCSGRFRVLTSVTNRYSPVTLTQTFSSE